MISPDRKRLGGASARSRPLPLRAAAAIAVVAVAALAARVAASAPPAPLLPASLYRQVLDVELNRHVAELGALTDSANATVLTRTYMSPAHRAAARKIAAWLRDAGASRAWVDPVGNVHGQFDGSDARAPVLVAGSHYDTMVDGGMYDGAMGVLAAVAAAKALALEARAAAAAAAGAVAGAAAAAAEGASGPSSPPLLLSGGPWAGRAGGPDVVVASGQWPGSATDSGAAGQAPAAAAPPLLLLPRGGLRVVAFADEEGMRFRSTFLGSRALAGTLVRHGQLDARDAGGATLAAAIARTMADDAAALLAQEQQQQEQGAPPLADGGEAAAARAAALPRTRADVERAVQEGASLVRTGSPGGASKYVEVHIEQGPVLESIGAPLGVVEGIAGQTWLSVAVEGEQAHAGTVPMGPLRRDALAAAAEVVLAVERVCARGAPERGLVRDPAEGLVCTVGSLTAAPGQTNVIAGRATLTVDVRCASDAHRRAALAAVEGAIGEACAARGVRCSVEVAHDAGAVRSDAGVVEGLSRAVRQSAGEWERVLAATDTDAALAVGGGGVGGGGAGGVLSMAVGRAVAWARGLFGGAAASGGATAATAGATGAASAPACSRSSSPTPPVLLSGAGHDAMAMAEVAPVGMIFVRCRGGVSHNPAEYAAPEDVARAAHALLVYFRRELLAPVSLAAVEGEGGCGCGGGGSKNKEL